MLLGSKLQKVLSARTLSAACLGKVEIGALVLPRVMHFHNEIERPGEKLKDEMRSYPGGSISLEKKDNGIGHIVIDNLEKRNAISGSMMVDFCEVLDELENWSDGVGVILRAKANSYNMFCSGGDLETVKRLRDENGGMKMCQMMHSNTTRLSRLVSGDVIKRKPENVFDPRSLFTVGCPC